MTRHPRVIQAMWLAVAAAMVALSATMQDRLNRRSEVYELTTPESVARNHPELALMSITPGGLRAPLLTYLWITADSYKNSGRYFDAMQLADLICAFQPHFEGVWYFHSWNMAWNIAATAHTAPERWLWIGNGMRLLRDQGIPLNPRSLRLYNQLGWIFYSKIGMTLDDYHRSYKQRWAAEMQAVLGAPPEGDTPGVIAAFEPIAKAPLDKAPDRQGRQVIQADQRDILLADPRVAPYAKRLQAVGLGIDEDFLYAYNRFSQDLEVVQTRLLPPSPADEREQAVSELVNAPDHAEARAKILAFLRAQLLWNRYRMDPQWMLGLMRRYNVPLDWRLPWPHAIYWITYGMHVCDSFELADINSVNTDRILLGSLTSLAWNGRMTYVGDPDRPFEPRIAFFSDHRYLDAVQNEYLAVARAITKTSGEPFERNLLKPGHINFLISAIQMCYVQHRYEQAQGYLDFIKRDYKMTQDWWELGLHDFVADTITRETMPTADMARNLLTTSFQMGLVFLAQGQQGSFRDNYNFAQRVYKSFQTSGITPRVKFPSLQFILAAVASDMIVYPSASGYYLPLLVRRQMYVRLDSSLQLMLYDRIASSSLLRREVELNRMDFQKLFPPPVGLEEYRKRQQTPDAPPALPTFIEESYTG